MKAIFILVALFVIILIFAWSIYNRLVKASNIVEEAFSGIDVQLQKRFSLIPSLVQAVKAYNNYEAELLTSITQLRNAESSLKNISSTVKNDQKVGQILKQFKVTVEAYPELKSNEQFSKLMDSLSSVENDLAMSRRYFNGATRDLNIKIEQFPAVLFAKKFGFISGEFYEIDDVERKLPEINLD